MLQDNDTGNTVLHRVTVGNSTKIKAIIAGGKDLILLKNKEGKTIFDLKFYEKTKKFAAEILYPLYKDYLTSLECGEEPLEKPSYLSSGELCIPNLLKITTTKGNTLLHLSKNRDDLIATMKMDDSDLSKNRSDLIAAMEMGGLDLGNNQE